MALSLKIAICQNSDCKSVEFSETTGAYSTSNTGGWGSPNPTIADATSAILTITQPDGTVTTIASSLLYPTFPTTDDTVTYTIDSGDLALGDDVALPDGIYTFVYEVLTTTGVYRVQLRKALYCQAECCVNGLLAKVATEGCDCSSELVDNALEAYFWLQVLKASECNETAFDNALEIINRICDFNSCNCS